MVSFNGRAAQVLHSRQAGRRIGTVAHDVAQTHDLVHTARVDVFEHGSERVEIGMNVGEYR